MNIANKTVLITGANRGIGLALLEEALNRGAKRVYAAVRGDFQHLDQRVTRLKLDVSSPSQILEAAAIVDSLDVLINNAGIALYDDLSDHFALEQQLAINLFGPFNMIRVFLPHLKRSHGVIVNNVSLAALAALPVIPGYSISKAAVFNMTQSFRAILATDGVRVHAAVIGPTDTDMNRGFDVPKATVETTAKGILDGIENGEDEIFPDPVSQSIAEGWRNGAVKAMERQFAGFVPARVARTV